MKPWSRAGQRGSVLAEFAMMSLAALTLIFAVVDFGRALYTDHLVSYAARAGTRYAIVRGTTACAGGTPDPMQSYVSGLAPGIDPSQMTVTTTCADSTGCTATAAPYNAAGCMLTISVTYPYHFMVPIVSRLTLNLQSTSQMVIAQ